jgi:mannose-1-phosphate guanylyltransferase
MAGGGGTRLWPLSRKSKPKQFIDLGTGKTLLEDAFARAKNITDTSNIYVATSINYKKRIKEMLPEVPKEHIFCEPEKRDTTAAFASIALRLQHINKGDEPTIFMWSDHVFTNEADFINDLKTIPTLVEANPASIIIVGHVPVTPETVLGYIEAGEKVNGQQNVYHVKEFKEKPDLENAKKFVAAGNYFWNLGYFSMKPDYLLKELQEQSPEVTPAIEKFTKALSSNKKDAVDSAYATFPKIAIEYTLIEKTSRIIAVTGDYGWSDVGNWGTVQDIFGTKGDHVPHGHHIHIDSQHNYIYNTTNKAVSLIGTKNTIVVVTDDAVLVTKKSDSHKVKEVVAKLEEQNKTDLI